MGPGPTVRRLSGDRLHLSHGPIDVVLKAWGTPQEVRRACAAALIRFETILDELVGELPALRRPASDRSQVKSPVARRMVEAVAPFADVFVTPMAAVAGSVADELMAAMRAAGELDKAFVNDGGDIAVHLQPGETLTVGVAGDFARGPIPALNGSLRLEHEHGVGGLATSGFQGRSFSLGIADAATVLAPSAAAADAAATLIANAVDVDSPAVERRPACDLDPDSDLGDRLVTARVGSLSESEIAAALAQGRACAEAYRRRGLIVAAALMLRGRTVLVGAPALLARMEPAGSHET
jgi:uncharacterized protein